MLELTVFDGKKNVVLEFEHSLLSLSKWEAKYQIPFQGRTAKSPDQMVDYFQDMLLSRKVDRNLVYRLTPDQYQELTTYINSSRTASSVPVEKNSGSSEVMTAELIYYYLAELNIPFEPTNSWHLSQTMMLIQMTAFKKQPEKKRKPGEVMRDWRAQNEKNKQILGIKD